MNLEAIIVPKLPIILFRAGSRISIGNSNVSSVPSFSSPIPPRLEIADAMISIPVLSRSIFHTWSSIILRSPPGIMMLS